MKRRMFNPLLSSSLYRQNNEARVGKAGVMVRSHLEAEAGSLEREARGVASLSTQGRAPGFALRSAPVPPFTREMLHRVRGGGGGRAPARLAQGGAVRIVCPALQVPFPRPPTPTPGRLVFTQRNPTPAPAKPLSLPNRALPRPCSCPPAPSVPSRLPFSIPSLSLKQRSIGLPATPPRALTSPHRAPGLAVFATRQYHKICPVLHPPLLVSTHLPNSLDGTTLTLHFSFSFLPSSFLFPIFLLS